MTRVRQKNGAVLVAALVCMAVVMMLLGSMLQGTLRERRQLHTQRDARQTELLLEAGLDRAAKRLAGDASYPGDTWRLTSEEIVGRGDGQVVVAVTRPAAEGAWQVKVVAEYPLGTPFSIQRSRTFVFQPTAAKQTAAQLQE